MADILYYSNYCEFSQKIVSYISKNNLIDKLSCICVDNRSHDSQNNNIIITLENGSKAYLPPSIQSVPTVLRKSKNHTLVTGFENILSLLQSESKYINEQEVKSTILQSNREPVSYDFLMPTSGFMEYDVNQPIQNMGNFVGVDSNNSINAPDENYKPDKLSGDITVDKLLEQRNSIKYVINT